MPLTFLHEQDGQAFKLKSTNFFMVERLNLESKSLIENDDDDKKEKSEGFEYSDDQLKNAS